MINGLQMTFSEAKADCEGFGATLVEIENQIENDIVKGKCLQSGGLYSRDTLVETIKQVLIGPNSRCPDLV